MKTMWKWILSLGKTDNPCVDDKVDWTSKPIDSLNKPIKWYLPLVGKSGVGNVKFTKRANRYLRAEYYFIIKLIRKGKLKQAINKYFKLMQYSKAFRIHCINKVIKGWYWSIDEKKVSQLLIKIDKILNELDTNPEIRRVYIPKSDNRWRPLGVPSKAWRVVFYMINEILKMLLEKHLHPLQFGFRTGRSGLDAWKYIIKRKLEGSHLYEFDLKACFNKISVDQTLIQLKTVGIPASFIIYMERILTYVPLVATEDIEEEEELKPLYDSRGNLLKGKILKTGMPQGASFSPLLSIFVIGQGIKETGMEVVMFADDGVVICNKRLQPFNFLIKKRWSEFGMIISDKVKKDGTESAKFTDILHFLGMTWDSIDDKILVGENWVKRTEVTNRMINMVIQNGYEGENKSKTWKWIIKGKSLMINLSLKRSTSWHNLILWILRHPMIVRKGFEFLDAQVESTRACLHLIMYWPTNVNTKRRTSLWTKFAWYGPELYGNWDGILAKDDRGVINFAPFIADRPNITWQEIKDREARNRMTLRNRSPEVHYADYQGEWRKTFWANRAIQSPTSHFYQSG